MKLFYALVALLGLAGAWLAIAVWQQRSFEARCQEQAWPGEFLSAPDGPVHVWCEGEGLPVVLLEASGLGSAAQYARVLPEVARRTTVCAWDRPGMGLSEPTHRGSLASDHGERIVAALTGAGMEGPFVVVGASAGGLVTLYLARRYPERVLGMVLLDALGPDGVDELAKPLRDLATTARRAEWAARLGILRQLDPLRLSERDACLTYRPTVLAAVSDALSQLPASAMRVEQLPPLPSTLPMLVLRHGRSGDLVGSAASVDEQRALEPLWMRLQEDLAAQSTLGRVEVVAESGHLIVHDNPQAVVRAIEDVVEQARRHL